MHVGNEDVSLCCYLFVVDRYGCCSDELTPSLGPYEFGCPPDNYSLLTYPQNLAVTILPEKDSLEAQITWDPPTTNAIVDLYTVSCV